MNLTPEIRYRNVRSSPRLRDEIRRRVATLSTFYPDAVSCKVLVEVPHRHHERGNHYCVRIDLSVPGETIVASYESSAGTHAVDGNPPVRAKGSAMARRHASTAFRQAFAAAKRQLQDYA